jgi:hypothetical protein
MIKAISKLLTKSKKPTQEDVVDFAYDESTINKAAEGSMQKRNDLLKRVELKRKHA